MKYRKKPVVVEAIQWTGENIKEVDTFCDKCFTGSDDLHTVILECVMGAMPGDFIIKGVGGEFYLCKPDIFMKTYEEVLE
jgi:hypothetical protein